MSQMTAWKTQTFAQTNRKVEVKQDELFRNKTLQMEAWLKGLPEIGGRRAEIWSPRNAGLPFFFTEVHLTHHRTLWSVQSSGSYTGTVLDKHPLSSYRTPCHSRKEVLYPLSSHYPVSPQPLATTKCFLSLFFLFLYLPICLFWIFHINGMIQCM